MSQKVLDILNHIAPHGKPALINGFVPAFEKYRTDPKFDLTTTQRVTHFLAQAAEETNGFNSFEEYASGAAYENRADLGNINKGDGVKYKGRGILMTTGRNNYKSVSLEMYGDTRLLDNPELLAQPEAATLAALYYWKDRNLNAIADKPDTWTTVHNGKTYNKIEWITKLINGGQNGLSVRELYFNRGLQMVADFFKNNPGTVALFLIVVFVTIFLTIKK